MTTDDVSPDGTPHERCENCGRVVTVMQLDGENVLMESEGPWHDPANADLHSSEARERSYIEHSAHRCRQARASDAPS